MEKNSGFQMVFGPVLKDGLSSEYSKTGHFFRFASKPEQSGIQIVIVLFLKKSVQIKHFFQ